MDSVLLLRARRDMIKKCFMKFDKGHRCGMGTKSRGNRVMFFRKTTESMKDNFVKLGSFSHSKLICKIFDMLKISGD